MIDNYYDEQSGRWVTAESRYHEVVDLPPFVELEDLILADPPRAWPLLLKLVDAVPDDLLCFVGAGPMESFVYHHGDAFIDRIEAQAARDPRFRDCAFEIDLTRGHFAESIELRIVAAIGGGFELRPPL